MTNTTLVPIEPVENMLARANVLVRSGLLPAHIREPEQAVAIMLRGQELGIGPMEALTSLNFIKGKVSSSTQLMLALIYRSGLLEDIKMTRGDPAEVTMKRRDMTPHTVTFGSEDARRAGLLFKDNYKKWPEVMFLWRALAICARVVFPDVIGAVYTPDELGVSLRSDSEPLIEGTDWKVMDEITTRPPAETIEQVKTFRAAGKSYSDIASETGLSVPEIIKVLKEA